MEIQDILAQYQETPWQTPESEEVTLAMQAEQFAPQFQGASIEEKKQFVNYFISIL